MELPGFVDYEFHGNSVLAYGWSAFVFVGALWAFFVARRFILARLEALAVRTATKADDFVVEMIGRIRMPECYLVALYFATRSLVLPARFDSFLRTVVLVVVAYRVVSLLSMAAGFAVRSLMAEEGADASRRAAAKTMAGLLQAFLWIGAVMFVLANLGFNITSMVAGLGIGGIAVALAAQAVLGDLFSAFAIFLDKPFEVGDAISFDGFTGTVEEIGIKTTRIRSLSGELLVVGNGQLTSTKVRNFKRMFERRVPFKFGVTYDTPEAKLAEVPALVKRLVESDPALRFDRAHFMNLGDSALEFEVVYWVKDPDYNKHMDSHQRLLLGLVRELGARGIEFAFPTRTIHVASLPAPAQ